MKIKKLKSPTNVNFTITNKCNQHCNFCFVDSNIQKPNFPLDKIKKVLDECAKAEVFEIKLFGGEPLIHPNFSEIVDYTFDWGFNVGFTSNGTLIDEKVIEKIVDRVDSCSISIHGFEDTHDKITGKKGAYKKALNAVKQLTNRGIYVGVLFTLTKENKEELYPFAKFILDNYNVGYFGVDRFVPLGRGTFDLMPSIKDFNNAFSKLLELKNKYPDKIVELGDSFPFCLLEKEEYREVVRGGCSAGFSFCEIDGAGNLKICPAHQKAIGNILEESLEEIWQNNEELENYRNLKSYISETCKDCKDFKYCLGGCRASSNKGDLLLQKYLPNFTITEKQKKREEKDNIIIEDNITGKPKLSELVKMRRDLDGYLIHYPRDHNYLVSEVGYYILKNCDGSHTTEEITKDLETKYKTQVSKDEVESFIKKFQNLIDYA